MKEEGRFTTEHTEITEERQESCSLLPLPNPLSVPSVSSVVNALSLHFSKRRNMQEYFPFRRDHESARGALDDRIDALFT